MPSGSYEWYFRLFGGLEAQSGSLNITRFRTVKSALLLGYLVCQPPHRFAREQLVELLWPQSEPDHGRASLSVCLNTLRNALSAPHQQESILIADRNSIGLAPQRFMSDVQEFEQAVQVAQFGQETAQQRQVLVRALDLYQGEFMAGYYADWVTEKSMAYHFQALSILEQLVDLDRDSPEHLGLWLQRLVELEPFNPQRLEPLVRFYMAQGNQELAARACEAWQNRWRREMAHAPPGSVQALSEQVRSPHRRPPLQSRSHPPPREVRPDKPTTPPPTEQTGSPFFPSLPRPAHPCYGRTAELQEIQEMLERSACVTLIGLGGMGKTRLALEVAHTLQESGSHIPCWVNLLTIARAEEIPQAIVGALGLPPSYQPLRQIALYCEEHPDTLFVLDNMEHLMPEARPVMTEILEQVPSFRCLVTSRIPLNIDSEQRFSLKPLALGCSPETPALQMFLEYARRVRPDFRLNEQNQEVLCRLCEALEGIPLALELAATRLNLLSPRQMLEQMEHRLSWLRAQRHRVRERHQSLRAVLDTTMNLLSPEARGGFPRLSVFPNAWTLEQAQQVCFPDTPIETLEEWLEEWIEAGLVRVSHASDETPSYTMLEVVREYASDQLDASAHADLWSAHRDWVLKVALSRQSQAYNAFITDWLSYWDAERSHLWQAIEFSLQAGEPVPAVQLMGATLRYYFQRPYLLKALEWLERAITLGLEPDTRIQAGVLRCHYLFRLERFTETYNEARTLYQLCEPSHPLYGWVMYWLVHSAYMVRDLALVERHLAEAETQWRNSHQDPHLTHVWHRLFFYLTPPDDSFAWVSEALHQAQRSGDPLLIGYAIEWQSEYWLIHGDYPRVLRLMDTLEQDTLIKDDPMQFGAVVITRAYCYLHQGQLDLAEQAIQKRLRLDRQVGVSTEVTLIAQVNLLRLQGRYEAAMRLAERLLLTPVVRESLHLTASVLEVLTRVALDVGDWHLAEQSVRQAVQARSQEADPYRVQTTRVLASLVKVRTHPEEAQRALQESLHEWHAWGVPPMIANTLFALSEALIQLGRLDEAEEYLAQAIALNQQMGRQIVWCGCVESLARLRARQGNPEEAHRLLQEAEQVRNRLGAPRPPAWQL
ncbi:MAG: BTAD domain-containing putative transcriptional regulator [Fimbriimonadales bacterium]